MQTFSPFNQGTVITDPPSIKALDPDTNGTNITYLMEGNINYWYLVSIFEIYVYL